MRKEGHHKYLVPNNCQYFITASYVAGCSQPQPIGAIYVVIVHVGGSSAICPGAQCNITHTEYLSTLNLKARLTHSCVVICTHTLCVIFCYCMGVVTCQVTCV